MPDESVNFDRAVEYYDATRGFPDGIAEQVGAFIAREAGLTASSQVLEVGIGTGRIALPLAPHVGSITGMDISSGMMGKLREKQDGEAIYLSQADAHYLPFANNSFDAAYITHVLHLVPDPARVLHEIQRVVKPDSLFIHTRNQYSNTDSMSAVVKAWNKHTKHNEERVKRWDSIDTTISAAGWHKVDERVFEYTYQSNLAYFLERIEQRQWSSTWYMDDDVWQRGLDAVKAAVDEHFDGDINATTPAEGQFVLQIYRQ